MITQVYLSLFQGERLKTQNEKLSKELEIFKNQMWAKDKALEVSYRLFLSRRNKIDFPERYVNSFNSFSNHKQFV